MYSIERSNSPGHAGKLGLFLYLLHGSQGELCYHCLLTGYFLNLFLAELAQSRWNIQANNSKKNKRHDGQTGDLMFFAKKDF